MLLLEGFSIDLLSFIVVVAVFTVIEVIASPLLTKLSAHKIPAMQGGVALVTTFVGLLVTDMLVAGLTIGGIANLLAATLLVWLGALAAGIFLPMFVFKELKNSPKN